MKHPLIAGLIGLAVIIAATVFMIAQGTLTKPSVDNSSPVEAVSMVERTASTTEYELSVSYPRDTRDAEGMIAADVESFLASLLAQWKESPLADIAQGESLAWKYQAWVSSTMSTSSVFDTRCHAVSKDEFSGGAHPNGAISTFCFDAQSRRLGLADVFSDEATALRFMASSTEDKLRGAYSDSYGEGEWLFVEGFLPTLENFSNFTITNEGLRVYFQSYQVGPYALGRPEVLWTWKELEQYLSEPFKNTTFYR